MASFNRVILVGNLTRDPEVRHLPSGMAVCDMRLAVSETFKNREGERTESVCYVDVVVWDRQAENCGEYLFKGSPVLIEGSLKLDEWTSKENEKRSKLLVRAQRVQFLGSPAKSGESRERGDATEGDRKADAERAAAPPRNERRDEPPPDAPRESAPDAGDEEDLPF
jgi:single-strand DNA-binding protein